MRFRNKVVWITGASSGIGEALAYAFSREGAHLALTARRRERLEAVRDACTGQGKILLLPFDVTDYDCHPTMVGAAIEHFGQVDILVNNAGVSQRSLVLETDFSVDRRIMEVNYFSVVSLTKTVLPYMIERGGGHIAVVSSCWASSARRCARRTAPLNTRCTATSMRCDRRSTTKTSSLRSSARDLCARRSRCTRCAATGRNTGAWTTRLSMACPPRVCARHILNALHKRKEEVYIARYEKVALYLKRFVPGLFSKLIRKAKVA
jgi:NADP-dependent 3-hydroxy acid dehydrogenase YdfG